MILILTNKQDVHTDEAIREFARRSVPVFRLNSEDILTHYKFDIQIEPDGKWSGVIRDELERELTLDRLRVAWLRKPEYNFNGNDSKDAGVRHFIHSETIAFIQSLLSIPTITWVNDYFVANAAKIKVQQLLLASKYGVVIPRSIFTNIPDAAERFAAQCKNSDFLTKSIYSSGAIVAGVERAVPSIRLARDEYIHNINSLTCCVTQIQEYIEKDFELRIVIIGKTVYAVKIESQLNSETKTDWRLHVDVCPHSVFELPAPIHDFCVEFVREQGLLFGAMDFIVTPEGEYVFLENNPFGQYLWLEHQTGIPLTREICRLLSELSEAVSS